MPQVEVEALAQSIITVGVAIASLVAGYQIVIGRRIGRVEEHLAVVKWVVEPNGADSFLPEHERGLTTQALIAKSRLD